MKTAIKSPPICQKHGIEKRRKFNSSLFVCPECEREERMRRSEARILKNKTLLAQCIGIKEKVSKTAGKRKKTPRQAAMDTADMYFSRYIRLKSAFETGGILVCKCYTCGSVHAMKSTDCGHWQRRGYKTTRFHEDNARPQCRQCNHYYQGKPEVFERNLVKEIGADKVNELKELAFQLGDDSEQFYREQADIYREKVKQLLKYRNIKNPWKK